MNHAIAGVLPTLVSQSLRIGCVPNERAAVDVAEHDGVTTAPVGPVACLFWLPGRFRNGGIVSTTVKMAHVLDETHDMPFESTATIVVWPSALARALPLASTPETNEFVLCHCTVGNA